MKLNHVMYIAATLLLATIQTAHAQSLDQLMPQSQTQQVTVNVACGDLQKSNCAQVLPHIAQYSAPQGVSINPISSKGSVQSAYAVCKNIVPFAVGQNDAFASVAEQTQCAATYQVIGQPLYPYYGYLIVLNSNKASSLDDLVNNEPSGKSVSIAVGKFGSGGQITFSNMLLTNSSYKQSISEVDQDWTSALGSIEDGNIDGYFVMDSPGSPLIASIKGMVDKNKQPIFKFLDVRPGNAFYALTDWNGKPMYQKVVISENCWVCSATKTVSTNAVLIVNSQWANSDANTNAVTVMRSSADQADAGIRAATLTPKDWTGSIGN